MAEMSWSRLLTRKRIGAPERPLRAGRPDYARDADKIVFLEAFRRLQGKTQVHMQGRDYARNRLTHSLEAAQVGFSLGSLAGHELARRGLLPEGTTGYDVGDAVRAAALAHDIGTVPYGHSGESTLQDWFRTSPIAQELLAPLDDHQKADLLRFEGNAVGFRILTRGHNGRLEDGPHLTMTTVASMVKYPGPSHVSEGHGSENAGARKFNWFAADAETFRSMAEELGLAPKGDGCWARHPLAFLVEAADDICYCIVDLEDAYRIGYLDFTTTTGLYLGVLASADHAMLDEAGLPSKGPENDAERHSMVTKLRALCISLLVEQSVDRFMQAHDRILDGTYPHELLDDIPAAEAIGKVKEASRTFIYDHPDRTQQLVRGHDTLAGLMNSFGYALAELARSGGDAKSISTRSRYVLKSYPDLWRADDSPYERLLRLTDSVAAMTDAQAAACADVLNGASLVMPPLGSHGKPWNSEYHT